MAQKKHGKSSQQWLNDHHSDYYVNQAKSEGYRSRAAYKLIELQQKDQLFKPGMLVVDLGAAPGGWSQVATQYIGETGKVIALDILAMPSIPRVSFIQGDFSEEKPYKELLAMTQHKTVDWVISDMAPNITGNRVTDQAQSIYLVELALEFAQKTLKKNGGFLAKVFQGEGFDGLIQTLRQNFHQVTIRKPHASRPRSREVYVIAIGQC